jgi:site-specific DNA-cytosine methylase
LVSVSDASEQGAGVCISEGLTKWGESAVSSDLSWFPDTSPPCKLLLISLFDGIGGSKVALDALGVPVCGYVSVESDSRCRKVVSTHHPGVLHIENVELVDLDEVKKWALSFGNASHVLLTAGAPCVGVSGLNSNRKGVVDDSRSALRKHIRRILSLVQAVFSWAIIHSLEENVASMDPQDEAHYSEDWGFGPFEICGGGCSWVKKT